MKRTPLRRSPIRRTRSKPRPGRLGAKAYRQLGEAIRHRDGFKCQSCTATRFGLHVHHIIYRSHGGHDAPANLITLCHRCHARIHAGQLFITGDALAPGFTTDNPRRIA